MSGRRRELARADKVLPGLWRLRLPLPWPGVPHVNAFAIAAGNGVVLVDAGLDGPGAMRQLELALDQAGLRVEHVRLVICTHAHRDHYGLVAPVLAAAGCELWMHPDHAHLTRSAAEPERTLERRLEVARQSGVPPDALAAYETERRDGEMGIAEIVLPHRELVDGVQVETDLGVWEAHETPGHAPSHVVLHQPGRGLLLSGDHLLGRVSLYFDYGYTPDPVGEFMRSLDRMDTLDIKLVLAGHGRPVREARALTEANRTEVRKRLERVRGELSRGPRTAYEIVPVLVRPGLPEAMMVGWGLTEALCYLRHLELRGEAERVDESDPERWALAT